MISRKRIGTTIILLIYILINNYIYINIYSPIYEYSGTDVKNRGLFIYLYVIFISLLPSFFIPLKITTLNNLFCWFYYLFAVILVPITSYHCFQSGYNEFLNITSYYIISFIFLCILLNIRLNIKNKFIIKFPNKIFYVFTFGCVITLMVYLFPVSNLKFDFNFEELYDKRITGRDKTATIFQYLLNNCIAVIMPVSAFVAVRLNSKILIVITILTSILVFNYDGSKITLLKVLLGFTFALKFNIIKNYLKYTLIILFTLISISLIELIYTNISILSNFFLHRFLFLPSRICTFYMDLFSQNISSESYLSVAYAIGDIYFNNDLVNANSNFIVNSLFEFGIFGPLIASIILFFIINFINYFPLFHTRFHVLIIILMSINLVESSLKTAIFTHGIFVSLILILFYNEEQNEHLRQMRNGFK